MTNEDYLCERAGILSTAVGLAHWHLTAGDPIEALRVLEDASKATHELLRDALIESGADAAKVDALIGKPR